MAGCIPYKISAVKVILIRVLRCNIRLSVRPSYSLDNTIELLDCYFFSFRYKGSSTRKNVPFTL